MIINWQDIFYFTASLVMIVTLIFYIWLMWLFFIASKMNFSVLLTNESMFPAFCKISTTEFLVNLVSFLIASTQSMDLFI